jgi:hypothetical protein
MNRYRVYVEEISRVKFYEVCEDLDFSIEIDVHTIPVYQEGRHYIITPRTPEAELSFVLKYPAIDRVK